MRLTLLSIIPRRVRAWSSSGVFPKSRVPAAMEAGFRRSCPTTAIKLLTQLRDGMSIEETSFCISQLVPGVEVKGDQLREHLEHSDDAGVL